MMHKHRSRAFWVGRRASGLKRAHLSPSALTERGCRAPQKCTVYTYME